MGSKALGLLLNDEIQDSLYKNYGGYQKFFSDLLTTSEETVSISVYDVVKGQLPEDPFEQQGWIVGGARSSITLATQMQPGTTTTWGHSWSERSSQSSQARKFVSPIQTRSGRTILSSSANAMLVRGDVNASEQTRASLWHSGRNVTSVQNGGRRHIR